MEGQHKGVRCPSSVMSEAQRQAFDPNQQALVELAKHAQHTGAAREEAKILLGWAAECGIPARSDMSATHWQYSAAHIHIAGYHLKITSGGG